MAEHDAEVISIHSLHTEGDFIFVVVHQPCDYFNPLPPHGGRPIISPHVPHLVKFQSTPSTRRETVLQVVGQSTGHHFNPLPPHGGRRIFRLADLNVEIISIHSLHTEGDLWRYPVGIPEKHFNPLPPHGGRRCLFSMRKRFPHFNPLPPHGGRLSSASQISTWKLFQSTPSTRRETWRTARNAAYCQDFNPLPPHGGRLPAAVCVHNRRTHFNPLPPHGGRRDFQAVTTRGGTFQSTPSTRRETGLPWDDLGTL